MIKKGLLATLIIASLLLGGCANGDKTVMYVSVITTPQAEELANTGGFEEEIDISESVLGMVYDNTNLIDIVSNSFDTGSFILPLTSYIVSSRFGPRTSPGNGIGSTNHKGIDLACPEGTKVVASMSGVVYNVQSSDTGYGNNVVLYHGEVDGVHYYTRYAHLSSFSDISIGQVVYQGDVIAYSGNTGASTGPHLHFEILENGVQVNPETYIEF